MRKVIISSEVDGKIYVKLDMAGYYHQFINDIADNRQDRDVRFQNGVALIIWGAFYLEAAINETSMKILEDGVHGVLKSADTIWSFVEKATTEKKFELILDLLMNDDDLRNKYKRDFMKLFKLRNRLAHYKEPRQQAMLSHNELKGEGVKCQLKSINKMTPNIVSDVINMSVTDRRKQILDIGFWIETAIYEYYKASGKTSGLDEVFL
ncbi:hypothetical protein OXH62_01305 [Pseudomonas chlororaphis]|uniref:hypothetical protein n=1 Tax=Pseudomonas chlororaphis TaxID=587753 RepID=UPI0035D42DB4